MGQPIRNSTMKRIIHSVSNTKVYLYTLAILAITVIGLTYYYCFSPMSKQQDTVYLYIDEDDDIDSVYVKIAAISNRHGRVGFGTLARHWDYNSNIKTGRYAVQPKQGAFEVLRHLRNGVQEPINLTIPEVKTKERLAGFLGKKMMKDSTDFINFLNDSSICARLGYTTQSIPALFIPNTYSIYWNTDIEAFIKRMVKEHEAFWKQQGRLQKAKEMDMTTAEIATLASIIDEETSNNGEKPMIAGMYLNRLRYSNAEYPNGMPLQADPTVKFAHQDFKLKRIYHKLLTIDSPYNTYKYPGLPPGPIKIASIQGIDAVLNHVSHNYLYMCAKEDFSGTHNFAETYKEHINNAKRYTEALNKRGIH